MHRIAPDIDLSEIDQSAGLREEFDIGFMDLLKPVTPMAHRDGIVVPKAECHQIGSFDVFSVYLGCCAS
ncbi:MAG: acyl carrier protein [Paracoccaceae bacterium]